MRENEGKVHFWQKYPNATLWSLIALVALGWLLSSSQGSKQRFELLLSLALMSFMIGSMVGFFLTSYGEETGTVGKVRDWLAGGFTGLTIAKFGALKAVLLLFAVGPGSVEFALTLSTATVGAGLGFFFMFFQRELIFNVLLARSRAERGRVEGTRQAGQVMQRFLLALPPSILSGIDDIDEILGFRETEAQKLRAMLYSKDVERFIEGADEALKSGVPLEWDIVSKAAVLHYYRMYFEADDNKFAQAGSAHEWIVRALTMNPLHVDLTVKLADTLAMMDRHEEAVAILERLERTPEGPAYVKQWLGFFLLNLPTRLDDAIRYSEAYHAAFPNESDSLFNVAYAYAEKYCEELRRHSLQNGLESKNRAMAISKLEEALRGEPEYAETIRKSWTQEGKAFHCFLHDPQFVSLVGLDLPTSASEVKN